MSATAPTNFREENEMNLPRVVSREQWLVARKKLLEKEKEFTRQRDALNAERRGLPMVAIDKDYVFEGPNGKASLLDLFDGCRQLIVQHFMFDPRWDEGCPTCSFDADSIGHLAHLRARDTAYAAVSRAPLTKIEPFKARMSWTFPWYSSYGSDFNYDFHVTLDEGVAPIVYNYRNKSELEQAGMSSLTKGSNEVAGVSVFLRHDNRVLHAYSTYGRGTDLLSATYNYLDLTPLGRQEGWGGTPDLNGRGDRWVRHHDNYDV
jgi:predicted dithiol-disulfide oxidoreductase (DUF899 family)